MLRIGGFTPLSTSDWPGMLAAVVFCQGCPWRCRYCHNPALIPTHGERPLHWPSILQFLRRRRGLLDAVVFSGGEPTLQAGLEDALLEVRALGFKIGIHTAGMYPRRLQAILKLVDWVGMDVKAPFVDYHRVTGVPDSGSDVRDSLALLIASEAAYEVRTTVHPALLHEEQVQTLADDLSKRGVKHYVIQAFRSQGCRDDELLKAAHECEGPLASMAQDISSQFASFVLRTS
jgi:pyruvate formate lyase activating enzyme